MALLGAVTMASTTSTGKFRTKCAAEAKRLAAVRNQLGNVLGKRGYRASILIRKRWTPHKELDSQFINDSVMLLNIFEVTALFSRFEVDVLINSAGITGKTNLKSFETDPADIARIFQVNLFGSYYTSWAVLPGMANRGYGRVLHIASIGRKEGNAGMLGYSSSKAAVISMAKVQGKEMAGTGVTVNTLAPAVIQTPLFDAMPEAQVNYMTEKIPLHRCGTLKDLVAMAEFIVSPACSFTTAFTFDLSGGRATY